MNTLLMKGKLYEAARKRGYINSISAEFVTQGFDQFIDDIIDLMETEYRERVQAQRATMKPQILDTQISHDGHTPPLDDHSDKYGAI